MNSTHIELLKNLLPLWYANIAWGKELLVRGFKLERAEDILKSEYRGRHQVPGTSWFIRTHGIGVDIFKTPEVGGIDFDFDKPDPDLWRLKRLFEKQINDGVLPYAIYQDLVEDEVLLDSTLRELLSTKDA